MQSFLTAIAILVGVLIQTQGEDSYENRNVWQCTATSEYHSPEYLDNPAHTHTWYRHNGLVAFATSLEWPQIQELHGFAEEQCHKFGKVRDQHILDEDSVSAQEGGWFDRYHTYSDIKKFFKNLAHKNPHFMKYVPSIGKSHKGRDLFAVHFTAGSHSRSQSIKRPKIYIQCLIHAREWISGSVCQYFAKQLVHSYKKSKKFRQGMLNLEYVMVPVVNPDGYEITMQGHGAPSSEKIYTARFWRKNEREFSHSKCMGVDLNRNFPYKWYQKTGSSSNKCREDYHGPYPTSEPEVRAVIKYMKRIRPVLGAIDFHSFSQLVLYPWSATKKNPPHYSTLKRISVDTAKSIFKVNKKVYVPMNGKQFFYLASGTFGDWAYSSKASKPNKGLKGNRAYRIINVTIELRPTANKKLIGFVLPEKQIKPTCREATQGIVTFTKAVLRNKIPL